MNFSVKYTTLLKNPGLIIIFPFSILFIVLTLFTSADVVSSLGDPDKLTTEIAAEAALSFNSES